MKKHKNLKIVVLLAFSLAIISIIVLLTFGKTYTLKLQFNEEIKDFNNLSIDIENDNIVTVADMNIDKNTVFLKVKGLKKGKTSLRIKYKEEQRYEVLYVHIGNIVSYETFFGPVTVDLFLKVSILILSITIFVIILKKYRKSIKENLYQYKNIYYLSLLILLGIYIISLLININNNDLLSILNQTVSITNYFSFIILPLALVTSILVTISNIRLLIKEGRTWKNMLGTILGLLFIAITLLPDRIYQIMFFSKTIDIHNSRSIWCYLYQFLETSIYLIVSYLECVLISTIILSTKAARRIPALDKDYIIILGCQIKKDGTLTPLLKGRVDRAIAFANMQKKIKDKSIIFIPSGGKGNDEIISEAEAMKNYLLEQGINKKDIIIEDRSTNTNENMKYSFNLIKNKKANIAFSTTNYHVFRSGVIATNNGIKIEGIGAKTKRYFWLNAFIREFIATIYSERKKHVIVLSLILLIELIMCLLIYAANIL